MLDKLGDEGFMKDLCSDFRLFMDVERGMITFESLKRNLGRLAWIGSYERLGTGFNVEGRRLQWRWHFVL
ncbi:hypothetical protein V6N13_011523 [Hibiscus sabdariffa]